MFSKEEIDQKLKETNNELDRLANAPKPLTKEDQSWQGKLRFRKAILDAIKQSKERGNKGQEVYHTTLWEMLIDWGERRPLLLFFVSNILKARLGMGGFRT